MNLFDIIAILIVLAALFSYVNHRTIQLPTTIGVMLIALLLSLLLIALHQVGIDVESSAEPLLREIDFDETVLHGMLAFLLFAGALHVDVNNLLEQRLIIGSLATLGVVLSTFIVGVGIWLLLGLLDLALPFLFCLLFGALISPTDPIAVLGILRKLGVPEKLETMITGESLFNDGVGVVVFLVLLDVVNSGQQASIGAVAGLFLQETAGGAAFGAVSGLLAYFMLKSLDNYQVEVLITLALVMGTYALAGAFHLSGPIAIVVAGLLIGNRGRALAMSDTTREHLDTFWELVDEILNAVLFVLIGIEVLVLAFTAKMVAAGVLAIPLVLGARFASVSVWVKLLGRFRDFSPGVIRVLTWGGLRGGLSVAMALSLPQGHERELIVAITYSVVVFSILVQGLTIGNVVERLRET